MKNETEQPESTEFPATEDSSHVANNDVTDEVLGGLDAVETESNADETTTILLDKLKVAEAEVLRSRAEMENYRKRMQRDADQQLKFANVPIVRDLLDVIDNLNRAIEAARGDETNTKALIDGVQMVSQQFNDALAKHGCKPIQAVGTAFDPNFHQAIAQTPSQDVPAGTVAMEVAVGYMLHDRVIRPAQVIVSTGSGS
ncbi:MAG: nucleotide exchange factor GrpE [Pirellulaceae bacterium]|nr:nucleotide exchange factor GrpE [Pirellulaceae bacterium]